MTAASTFGHAHYVSVRRAAEVLGKTPRAVQYLCKEGAIPATKMLGESRGRGRGSREWLVPVRWLRGLAR